MGPFSKSLRAVLVAAGLTLAPGLPARAADAPAGAGCSKWSIEVTCATSTSRVVVGDAFTATVSVRNTGDYPLLNVTIALRGDLGSKAVGETPSTLQTVVDKLEPGASKDLSGTYACGQVGFTRVLGSGKDSQGWAAANCACAIEVVGLPAIQSEMVDKAIDGKESGIFSKGEDFLYVLNVENDQGSGATPDLMVVMTLPPELEFVSGRADHGVTVTGAGQEASSSTFTIPTDQVQRFVFTVRVIRDPPPNNLVQTRASIQTAGGIEVAQETESTTIR